MAGEKKWKNMALNSNPWETRDRHYVRIFYVRVQIREQDSVEGGGWMIRGCSTLYNGSF